MSLIHIRPSLPVARTALATLGALLLAACPGDDTSQETDATEGADTGTATTTTDGPDPDTNTGTTADPDATTGATTEVLDDTGTTTTGELPGICTGLTVSGYLDTVLSRDGMPIDATCAPDPTPCGGDVVGTWALEDSCGFEAIGNPFEDICPGATFSLEIMSQMGTMTFEDDGTFVQDFEIVSEIQISLDSMACFGLACDAFEGSLQEDNPTATCQDMGGTCNCTIPDSGMPEQNMGTYEVIGNDIVLTIDGEAATAGFCIDSDRLDLWQPLFGDSEITAVPCMDELDCVDALGDMYDAYSCSIDEG